MPISVIEGDPESPKAESFAEVDRLRERIAHLEERVRQLDELAHLDPLLGVPNRRGFLRELEAAIARVTRYNECAAMLFVDIDGLKRINDSFGHNAGDQALVHVATMLTNGVRKSDCVARLGGDEFGILLAHADETIARETSERLTAQTATTDFDGKTISIGIAVGFTMIEDDDTPDAAIARADRAMYRDKSSAAA